MTATKMQTFLLSDPGFAKQLGMWLTILAVSVQVVVRTPDLQEYAQSVYFQINDWMLGIAHQNAWWSLLGLLSSSCCALQLLLNAMHLGCAGFNSILGPKRPFFLALTITIQAGSWYVAWLRPWMWAPTAISCLIAISLSLLPEILQAFLAIRKARKRSELQDNTIPSTQLFRFRMTSVGCSACLVGISDVLSKLEGVTQFDPSLETGMLTVQCTDNVTANEVLKTLENAGFPMESVKC